MNTEKTEKNTVKNKLQKEILTSKNMKDLNLLNNMQ